jgi:hypothetical protein
VRVLRREILGPVLADDVDTCLREDAELLDADVLRRDDHRDVLARLLTHAQVALANRLRRRRR